MKVHERVRGWRQSRNQAEGGFTLPEVLIAITICGIIVGALASAFSVGAKTTAAASTRLNESHDTQLVSAYFVSDGSSASSFSTAAQTTGCASGTTPIASFEWTDNGVTKDAYYIVNSTTLTRRYCENGTKQSDIKVAQYLGSTTPTVTCPLEDACSTTPAAVQLNVTESSGYTFKLRATPRPTGTGSNGMGGIAVYVGNGGLDLRGNSTITIGSGVATVMGSLNCSGSGSGVTAPDGFFASSTTDCSPTQGSPPPDPLLNLATPAVPSTSQVDSNHPNSTLCGTSQSTYQPGYYAAASSLSNGCLASGTYYFGNGVTLNGLTSAPGGVHIYVASGDVTLDGTNTLSPLTTGNQAGVTLFLGRSNIGTIELRTTQTVNGTIYAPAGTLYLQSNNANITTSAINVYSVLFKGNGSGVLVG